jgi:hypothetical protein
MKNGITLLACHDALDCFQVVVQRGQPAGK